MSGDVQPRKRKDKKRKKEDVSEDVGSIFSSEENIHVHKDAATGGNACAKIVFFFLLGILLVMVGLIITEYRGSTDLDNPILESRWAPVFEGWLELPSKHGDHEEAAAGPDHDEHDEHDEHEDHDELEEPGHEGEDEDHDGEEEEEEEEAVSREGEEEEEEEAAPKRAGVGDEDDDEKGDKEGEDEDEEEEGDEDEEAEQEQVGIPGVTESTEDGDNEDEDADQEGAEDDDDDDDVQTVSRAQDNDDDGDDDTANADDDDNDDDNAQDEEDQEVARKMHSSSSESKEKVPSVKPSVESIPTEKTGKLKETSKLDMQTKKEESGSGSVTKTTDTQTHSGSHDPWAGTPEKQKESSPDVYEKSEKIKQEVQGKRESKTETPTKSEPSTGAHDPQLNRASDKKDESSPVVHGKSEKLKEESQHKVQGKGESKIDTLTKPESSEKPGQERTAPVGTKTPQLSMTPNEKESRTQRKPDKQQQVSDEKMEIKAEGSKPSALESTATLSPQGRAPLARNNKIEEKPVSGFSKDGKAEESKQPLPATKVVGSNIGTQSTNDKQTAQLDKNTSSKSVDTDMPPNKKTIDTKTAVKSDVKITDNSRMESSSTNDVPKDAKLSKTTQPGMSGDTIKNNLEGVDKVVRKSSDLPHVQEPSKPTLPQKSGSTMRSAKKENVKDFPDKKFVPETKKAEKRDGTKDSTEDAKRGSKSVNVNTETNSDASQGQKVLNKVDEQTGRKNVSHNPKETLQPKLDILEAKSQVPSPVVPATVGNAGKLVQINEETFSPKTIPSARDDGDDGENVEGSQEEPGDNEIGDDNDDDDDENDDGADDNDDDEGEATGAKKQSPQVAVKPTVNKDGDDDDDDDNATTQNQGSNKPKASGGQSKIVGDDDEDDDNNDPDDNEDDDDNADDDWVLRADLDFADANIDDDLLN